MNTDYIKLDFWGDIDGAVKELQDFAATNKNRKACISFNGHMLYSDTVTLDSAYLEITGKTKKEFDNMLKKEREERERKEQEYKETIPERTQEWISKGHEIIDKKYWDLWDKCVPIRLNDLYQGMELGACLEVIEALNTGCTMDKAKEIIDKQGHSGMSYGLVQSMIKSFCDRGQAFGEFCSR